MDCQSSCAVQCHALQALLFLLWLRAHSPSQRTELGSAAMKHSTIILRGSLLKSFPDSPGACASMIQGMVGLSEGLKKLVLVPTCTAQESLYPASTKKELSAWCCHEQTQVNSFPDALVLSLAFQELQQGATCQPTWVLYMLCATLAVIWWRLTAQWAPGPGVQPDSGQGLQTPGCLGGTGQIDRELNNCLENSYGADPAPVRTPGAREFMACTLLIRGLLCLVSGCSTREWSRGRNESLRRPFHTAAMHM